jgi:exodeoxyribonuclease VII large subunit
MPETATTNAAEVSVSELSNALKRTIEDRFGYVRVRGEVSGWRGPHSSGHCYFALKDASAKIDAVIWKGTYGRMRVKPEEGLEVIATGKLTTFPGKSSYQIVVESVEPAGVGALMALLEDRRRKLAAEGLFDAARKQLVPFLPQVIGVVTSPTGAVIRDILHRIADRFPRHVLVWPVRVQGETSAAEVARAIDGFNALPEDGPLPRPSVIIVARGGGSLEDLWGFNEEVVVRAAAASLVPLVSAVGHETDWTLIDHAADLRAPTPTGAAEMCVPVRSDLMGQIADLGRRHAGSWHRLVDRRRADLRALARAMPSGEDLVSVPRQRLDRAAERLDARVRGLLDDRKLRVGRAATLLARHAPQAELARARERTHGLAKRLAAALGARARLERQALEARRQRLAQLHPRLARCARTGLDERQRRLAGLWQLMRSLSHVGVLERGFALVTGEDGHPLRSVSAVSPGQPLTVRLVDGQFGVVAEGDAPRTKPSRPSRKGQTGQGSLF